MNQRLKRLKNKLSKYEQLPYLVTDLINIRYLINFDGTNGYLLIGPQKSYFITDARYEEYARSILPSSVEFVLQTGDFTDVLRDVLKKHNLSTLHLEEHSLVFSLFLIMKKKLRGVRLIPGGDVVNELRMVKDENEIDILREAAEITDQCVEHLKGIIRPGILEWDVAVEIEFFFRKHGCDKTSFDSIVASGKGSSMPHYQTSMKKKIAAGDGVLIDMGGHFRGYNSDLTRTMFVGSIDRSIKEIYSIVKKAQDAAINSVKPGVTTGKLDGIARTIISKHGYGDYFGHSLGHGLGMEVHELPAVKAGDTRLKKNMVITIEPGIYVPGLGGVRIEDMVLVTNNGCEVLTRASKDIIVV